MLALVLGTLLPALAVGGYAAWRTIEVAADAAETRLRDTARALALAVDREIAAQVAALAGFATSPAFDGDAEALDLAMVDGHARRVAATLGTQLSVLRRDGTRIVATALPFGAALPPSSVPEVLERVFTTGRPVIADIVTGGIAQVPVFSVALPIRDGRGEVALVAMAAFRATRLRDLLARQGLPDGAFAAITDSRAFLVARSDSQHDALVGQPVPAANTVHVVGRKDGVYRSRAMDGATYVFGFRAVPAAPGWHVFVAQPEAEFGAPRRAGLRALALGSGATLLIGTTLALLLARGVLLPVRRLETRAALFAAGQAADDDPPSAIREMDALRRGFDEAATAIAARTAALAESEERLRLALEGARLGTWDLDLEGGRSAWSARAAEIWGQPADGPGRSDYGTWRQRVHPEDLPRLDAAFAAHVAGDAVRYAVEYRYRGQDSAWRWVSSAGRVVARDPRTGRAIRAVGVVEDVTARREAEVRLAESVARLRLAQRVGGIASYEWDVTTNRALYSDTYAEMHGLPPGTLSEAFDAWLARVHAEDREHVGAAARSVLGDDPVGEIEYRIVRPSDGAVRTIAERREVFRDAAGQVVRVLGSQQDVTERREAEAVLRRSREELERLVEARTRDLQEAQARLAQAQRMEALGQLAGGIAHDFNNVLQAIGGAAKLIEAKPEDAGRAGRLARLIGEATTRGASVTRRLLAFSRRADLRAEPLDAAELLAGLREVLTHTLGAGIEVRLEAEPDLPLVLADKGQLETVLINLATNARDAMGGAGRLTLRAALEVVDAERALLRPRRYLRLSVADTGAGMDAATLARAAEPFFTTKPRGKGTGLGLAMARGFAEQSGGALRIESAPVQGTEVHLWLPVAEIAAAGPGPAPDAMTADIPVRVLLVDDEALVRQVTAEGLEAQGLTVMAVASAEEALVRLDEAEVLVTDLSMPGTDGLGLIREAQGRRPDLPAILLTGFATDTAELAPSASLLLIRKPVPAAQLADRIRALARPPGAG
ncbi:MAG: PAS domain-containing protein [Acetobacteraceae bacterium]|nr:PAS domain-containing protein [Acetobacteraceae bacterium]